MAETTKKNSEEKPEQGNLTPGGDPQRDPENPSLPKYPETIGESTANSYPRATPNNMPGTADQGKGMVTPENDVNNDEPGEADNSEPGLPNK